MFGSKAKKMEQLSGMIVQSLAASIQNLDPIDEICDMLVESSGYKKALYAWKDQHTGLNLLQLAVVSKHLDVVKMFCMEKHKGSFRQTWHGEYYNPLLHLACKVGALSIIRYLVEQQNADMTAEGVVTYPNPVDSHTSSHADSPVWNSSEIHVFMNRSERNYLSLQGEHEYDISYGAGHSSFLSEDKKVSSLLDSGERQSENSNSQMPPCLAGPSTSYSSQHTQQKSMTNTAERLSSLSLNPDVPSTSRDTSSIQLKEAKQIIGQTPYQICVAEGHVVCANYLCLLIISRMEKPIYHIHESPLLHKVSYLGCAQHLQLLLKHGHQRHINDKDHQGHMPIHIASLTANPECIEVLLKHGASVNSRADHRTCLQIMYWSKFRPENFVLCSEILVRYGMDVNAMDHNNNTALDYLAWELGQKWYQISKAWVKTHRIAEINNYLQPAAYLQEHILSDDQFRQEIFCCMQVLLAAGASTLVISRDSRVDHTIVHTLLQNTGWPLNSSLRKRPMEVYKALDLFFHYGADPNVIARNNNESAMTMLLMHSLHEIPNILKVKFVALFLMNGANLECLIPEPKQYRENYSDRRWNIYPVMVALQERHPIDVVRLLYDFMSLRHVYRSLRMTEDKFLWHRMTWSLGGAAKDNRYREQWLAIRIPRVRTLRHCCKLSVFKAVGRRAVLIDDLPLPRPLKRYLQDTDS